MARKTCLNRPGKKKYYAIQIHHLKMFRGDEALAKLLFVFDWLTINAIEFNDTPEDNDSEEIDDTMPEEIPWIEASIAKIRSQLGNTVGKTTIVDRIPVLERLGVLTVSHSRGSKTRYQLNVQLLNEWIDTSYVVPAELLSGPFSVHFENENSENTRPKTVHYQTENGPLWRFIYIRK